MGIDHIQGYDSTRDFPKPPLTDMSKWRSSTFEINYPDLLAVVIGGLGDSSLGHAYSQAASQYHAVHSPPEPKRFSKPKPTRVEVKNLREVLKINVYHDIHNDGIHNLYFEIGGDFPTAEQINLLKLVLETELPRFSLGKINKQMPAGLQLTHTKEKFLVSCATLKEHHSPQSVHEDVVDAMTLLRAVETKINHHPTGQSLEPGDKVQASVLRILAVSGPTTWKRQI